MSLDNILSDVDKLEMLRDATPSNVGFGSIDLINRSHPLNNLANTPYKEDLFSTKTYISQERRPEIFDESYTIPDNQTEFFPPPFYPTVFSIDDVLKLRMVTGYIHTQKNAGDAMVDLEVAGIPVIESEITVTAGTKCFVSAQEDAYGTISDPQFGTGSDWPTSIAPILIGGDNRTGTPGVRYWRLCEINGEDSVTIHRTGIIEHFIPRRVENASYSMSSNQGRFYKEYLDTDYGIYQMRVAWGLRGLCVEEENDQTKNHLKLLMPPGTDGAILHFTGASPSNDEVGSWVSLPAPSSSSPDGYEWVLKNVPSGPPVWVQRPIIPTGSLNDMLVHNGTKWVVFAAPPSSGTYIHAFDGTHKWLATEACS